MNWKQLEESIHGLVRAEVIYPKVGSRAPDAGDRPTYHERIQGRARLRKDERGSYVTIEISVDRIGRTETDDPDAEVRWYLYGITENRVFSVRRIRETNPEEVAGRIRIRCKTLTIYIMLSGEAPKVTEAEDAQAEDAT